MRIRSWKRDLKKIESWYEDNLEPNIDALNNHHEIYVKLNIPPWTNLNHRKLPLKLFRKILGRLDRLYDNWFNNLSSTDLNFDLQLWIFENNFEESELVCSVVNSREEKRDNYFEKSNENIPFPISRFKTKLFNPDDFQWSIGLAKHRFYENLDNLTTTDISKLLNKNYQVEIIKNCTPDKDRCYWKTYDRVWIGRK